MVRIENFEKILQEIREIENPLGSLSHNFENVDKIGENSLLLIDNTIYKALSKESYNMDGKPHWIKIDLLSFHSGERASLMFISGITCFFSDSVCAEISEPLSELLNERVLLTEREALRFIERGEYKQKENTEFLVKYRFYKSDSGERVAIITKRFDSYRINVGIRVETEDIKMLADSSVPIKRDSLELKEKRLLSNRKNPVLAAVLGFFALSLGLFYVSPKNAFYSFLAIIASFFIFKWYAALFMWPGCALYAYIDAIRWNSENEEF